MNLISIPAFQDNYIWILSYNNRCLIVDPGEALPVIRVIKKNKWKPEAIFLTHHHNDHVGGVITLCSYFPNLIVYGPEETRDKGVTRVVYEGEIIPIFNRKFSVFSTPGHTFGHICFFSFPYLFCGDTLFSGGCGRIFEGTSKQMYQSLQKINQLPVNTLICCAHEYTLENMKFAITILPNDLDIQNYYHKVYELRARNRSTLPVILKHEQKINLFLRIESTDFFKKISKSTDLQHPEEYFSWLRLKKDNFTSINQHLLTSQ